MDGWVDVNVVKRMVLLYWAAWLSIITATNVFDGLRALGALPQSFAFTSSNWGWINQTMDPLGVPRTVQGSLFLSAVAWEALAGALFWRACVAYRGRPLRHEPEVIAACGVNLGLWAAFQVLDEVFLAYQPEAVHRMIFLNQLATLLALHLLPNGGSGTGTDQSG
jgi:hypothetical protein